MVAQIFEYLYSRSISDDSLFPPQSAYVPVEGAECGFKGYADPVPAIIEALDGEKIYRDDIVDRPPLGTQWGQGRVTLIGDAAHPVQPSIGQGGCMAVEDSFELAKLLFTSRTGGDTVPSLLRQFEASRTQRVSRVFNSSRQIGKLAQADTAIGCLLRNGIYKLTPTRLADLQFKWLFDYQPQWNQTRTNDSE